jgi:hypothetical protein
MPLTLWPPVRLITVTARERHNNVPVRMSVVMRIDRSWCSGDNARCGCPVRSRGPRCTGGGRRIAVPRWDVTGNAYPFSCAQRDDAVAGAARGSPSETQTFGSDCD